MKNGVETSEKTQTKDGTSKNNRLKNVIKETTEEMSAIKSTAEFKLPEDRMNKAVPETEPEKAATAAETVKTDEKKTAVEKTTDRPKVAVGETRTAPDKPSRSHEMNSFIGKITELQVRKKHVVKSAAFISNKGGVGKTHISSNMSFYMSRLGKKALLIDLDLGNSDVSNKLGFFCKNTIMDLMHGRQDVDQLIYSTPYGFDLVAGESGNYKLANLTAAQKNRFIKALRRVSGEYDFVLYDLSAGISAITIDFALAQDYQLIVTTPQDIIAGYSCIKAAFYRFREVEKALANRNPDYKMQTTFRPFVILNQVPDFATGRALYEKIVHVSRENIRGDSEFNLEINLLGVITADQEKIRDAELKHYMYSNSHGATKTGQCFHFMSHNLIQYRDPNNMEFTTKFQRFVDLFMKGVEEFKYAQ